MSAQSVSREPRRIEFPGPAAPSAVPGARGGCHSPEEPGALVFPVSRGGPHPAAQPPAMRSVEPSPLAFPAALQANRSNAPTEAVSEPAPLQLPSSPAATRTAGPGRAAFGVFEHPMQQAAQHVAQTLEPNAYAADQARVHRYIAGLLPFKQDTVETWGAHTTEDCRLVALRAADLTRQFSQLNSTRTLSEVLDASTPASSLLGKVRQQFSQTVEQRTARVSALKASLDSLLREVRQVLPQARDEARRMAALLLALRAVAQSAGNPPTASFELVLEQRLGLLRAALLQINQVPVQLEGLESTAVLQAAQCDRLVNVTLSALALAGSRRK